MNGKELDAALEAAGGNLTEAIRRELAANGDARAAAAGSGFEFWARCFIPDADEAKAMAKERGMIFGADARGVILAAVTEARRCFDALTRGDGREAMNLDDDFEEAIARSKAATARANTCINLACAALRGIAFGKGDAAKLARGAIADFLNCLAADDAEAATWGAFKAANDAARAYFVEKYKWGGGETGKGKRKRTPQRLMLAARAMIHEGGFLKGGRITEAARAKFEMAFSERFPTETLNDPEMAGRILESCAREARKPDRR